MISFARTLAFSQQQGCVLQISIWKVHVNADLAVWSGRVMGFNWPWRREGGRVCVCVCERHAESGFRIVFSNRNNLLHQTFVCSTLWEFVPRF